MAPWLIHLSVLILGAMLFSLGISLYDTDFLTKTEFVGLDNYRRMFNDPLFWKSLGNTAYYTFAMVPLSVTFALIIALLLNQKVKFLGVYRTLYYIPSIVSGVAIALLWSYLLNPRFGLINQGLALLGISGPEWIYSQQWAIPAFIMMGVWGAGGNMLLYLAGLQGIPTTLYEAAKIDGANGWHRFWRITLPMLTPTIYFNLLINMIGAWQVFSQSYIMTSGGPNNATLTMVLYLYRKGFEQFHFGYAAALAWTIFVIIMLFTLLVVRSSEAWVYYEGEMKR
jgi:multiple sugar transport system permease protein